jgi:hypothetical protein
MNLSIFRNRKFFVAVSLFLFLFLFLLTAALLKKQETITRAAKSTIISLLPASTQNAPLKKTVNQTVPLDIMLDPGTNLVSLVKLEINYDSTKLQPNTSTPLVVDTNVFSAVLEGPVYTTGKIAVVVSIGSDPTKAITQLKKLGTVTFIANSQTSTPSAITIANTTQVLSIGPNDQASDNVLSSTVPAYISISQGAITPGISASPFPTTILTPTTNLTPTIILTPSITPTISATINPTQPLPSAIPTLPSGPSATPSPARTTFVLNLRLHGIGAGGDIVNPGANKLSNKNPIHQEIPINIQIANEDNRVVATKLATAFYNSDNGLYFSNVVLSEPLAKGDYIVKTKADRFLQKIMPGFITVDPNAKNNMPTTDFINGDVNSDNALNILDYNILLDCGYGVIKPLSMIQLKSVYQSSACSSHENSKNADLNDNGTIEASDYNLFLRELSAGFGD